MATVRTYTSSIKAQQARALLQQSGIPAAILSNLVMCYTGRTEQYQITVEGPDEQLARELLAEHEAAGAPDHGWEVQALPDLTRLPAHLIPPCPSCAKPLLLLAGDRACPSCGIIVDLVALVIQRHGPEALIICYPDEDDNDANASDLTESSVQCAQCRYSLTGLPRRGVCPECGVTYDKQHLLQQQGF